MIRKLTLAAAFLCAALILCAMAAPVFAAEGAATTTLDLSPYLGEFIQGVGALLAALAIPVFWYVWGLVAKHFNLAVLKVDDAQRAVIDQGLQKAIGYAVSRASGAAARQTGTGNRRRSIRPGSSSPAANATFTSDKRTNGIRG